MKLVCLIIFTVIPLYVAREFRQIDYNFYPELNGWLKIHTAADVFHAAKKTCENEGAILASPTGLDFLEKMKYLMRTGFIMPVSIYTGIRSDYPKGSYLTIDRKPIGKISSKWATGEPNYDRITGDEICVLLHPNGTMAIENCVSIRPFICYKKVGTPVEDKCGPTPIDKKYTYSNVTRNCYRFQTVAKSWDDAFFTCLEDKAFLTTVNAVEDAVMLKEMYKNKMIQETVPTNVHFIGFRYFDDVKTWLNVFGQSLLEAAFIAGGEAVPFEAEKPMKEELYCSAIDMKSDKVVVLGVSCEQEYPFICKKPAPVEE